MNRNRIEIQDEINALLPEEFRTVNGIPTDPATHKLFYVKRLPAGLASLMAIFVGLACGLRSVPLIIGAAVVWLALDFWAFA
jgi:hypothetical protein